MRTNGTKKEVLDKFEEYIATTAELEGLRAAMDLLYTLDVLKSLKECEVYKSAK